MDAVLKKVWGFDKSRYHVRTELMAGLTTFLTIAYVLAVHPDVLSVTGMDKGALFTTTILASALATLCMSLVAKLPFAVTPGMGMNAFFAYTVCQQMGCSWQFALTAVFLEGLLFIVLTLTGLRQKLVLVVPQAVRDAITPGIGLFVAFVGLKNAGFVVGSESTLLTLGDFSQPGVRLFLIGMLLMSLLLVLKVQGAMLLAILATTLIGIPMGVTHWNGLVDVPPSIAPIFCRFEWGEVFSLKMLFVLVMFLFVDLFSTVGSLYGVVRTFRQVGGEANDLKKAFMADAIGTTAGAVLGTSGVCTLVESTTGIKEGARTGLASFAVVVCLLLSLFFAPFFLSIPSSATAPALVIVGLLMASSMKELNFDDYKDAIPSFLCLVMMPFAYSITDGIALGVLSFVLLNLLSGHRDRIAPATYLLFAFFLLKYLLPSLW